MGLLLSYLCIFIKLREKLRKKRESRARAKNIEMVILDSPEEMVQTPNLNKSSWSVIKNWVQQKSFRYEDDPNPMGDPNCASRKTSATHLSPHSERSVPPSPNPSNVDEISVKSSETVRRNESKKPKVSFHASFRESLKNK